MTAIPYEPARFGLKKYHASLTPEERSARASYAATCKAAKMTVEERKALSAKMVAGKILKKVV